MARSRLLLALITTLIVVGAVGLVLWQADSWRPSESATQDHAAFRAGVLPQGISGARAPQFTLDDARGGRMSTASLKGRPYVVTFLYADCQDVCPLIAQEIKQAFEQLGRRGRELTAVAVTADPEGDTPTVVRSWLQRMRMPARFRYLVGSRDEVEAVWRAHYAAGQPEDRLESAHSASIWLVDRRGRWRAKFSGGIPVPPSDIAHDLRILLDERAEPDLR